MTVDHPEEGAHGDDADAAAQAVEDEDADFFGDIMLGREGVTEGVITHW
jgi:hypothetical protein